MLSSLRSAASPPASLLARSLSGGPASAISCVSPVLAFKSELKKLSQDIPALSQLEDLRSAGIYREVREWAKTQAAICGSPDHVFQSRKNAAEAHALTYALHAVTEFGHRYVISLITDRRMPATGTSTLESAFLRQIQPGHRQKLFSVFRESFIAETDERQAMILSALSPTLTRQLHAEGILPVGCGPGTAAAGDDPAPAHQLGEAELLALVDYVNSTSGTFNAVNGTAIAKDYYGETVLASALSVFRAALCSAVDKLCSHEAFGRRNILACKGIRLDDLASGFRLHMLEAALKHRRLVAFPSVLSASSRPDQSYFQSKFSEGYSAELQLRMPVACAVDAFHDSTTKHEQEILAPAGLRCRVIGKTVQPARVPEYGADAVGDRYELAPE